MIGRKPARGVYARVAKEMAAEIISPSAWARAIEEAKGNEERAQAEYIRLRAAEIEEDEAIEQRRQVEARAAELRDRERQRAVPPPPLPVAALTQTSARHLCRKCRRWSASENNFKLHEYVIGAVIMIGGAAFIIPWLFMHFGIAIAMAAIVGIIWYLVKAFRDNDSVSTCPFCGHIGKSGEHVSAS